MKKRKSLLALLLATVMTFSSTVLALAEPLSEELTSTPPAVSAAEESTPPDDDTTVSEDTVSSDIESDMPTSEEETSAVVSEDTTAAVESEEEQATLFAFVAPKSSGKTLAYFMERTEAAFEKANLSEALKMIPDSSRDEPDKDAEVYQEGNYYYTMKRDNATLVAYTGRSTDLVLPETLGGLPLTGIEETFLAYSTKILSVTIPKTVTEIALAAFLDPSTYLETILVDPENSNFQSIDGVLYDASGTTLLAYPNGKVPDTFSLPAATTVISFLAFCGTSLNSITIPEGVTGIYDGAFYASNLRRVTLPESLQSIGMLAFDSTRIKTVNIPENVYYIGASAFGDSLMTAFTVDADNQHFSAVEGVLYTKDGSAILEVPCMKNLGDFELPKSVTMVGEYAFAYNNTLTSFKTAENSELSMIDPGAFTSCNELNSVDLSNSTALRIIEEGAFYSCNSLSSVLLPEGLLEIRESVFAECPITALTLPTSLVFLGADALDSTKITAIHIPKNVREFIDSGVFSYDIDFDEDMDYDDEEMLEDLTYTYINVTVDAQNPYYTYENMVLYNKEKTTLYFYHPVKQSTSFTIPNTVTTIAEYAIDAVFLEKLYVPVSVTTIGEYGVDGAFTAYCFKGSALDRYYQIYSDEDNEELYYTVSFICAYPTLKLSSSSLTLSKGKTATLTSTLSPKLGGDAVTYTSSNTKVATVNSSGVVTGVATGTATITATAASGAKKTCAVTVADNQVQLSVTAGIHSATLKWDKISGVTGYAIYQATSKDGSYTRIASTSSLSYTKSSLTYGKTYYYKVRSYKTSNGKTTYGAYSSVKSATLRIITKVTGTDKLNVRTGPSNQSIVLGYYTRGTEVDIEKISGKWLLANDGWVSSTYITSVKATVSGTNTLNIRSSASSSGKLVGSVKKGTTVKVYAEKNGWFLIDKGGWVSGKYLK